MTVLHTSLSAACCFWTQQSAGSGQCCVQTDAELTDAGLTDAGLTDAGLTDARLTDAGLTDAGLTDAKAESSSL